MLTIRTLCVSAGLVLLLAAPGYAREAGLTADTINAAQWAPPKDKQKGKQKRLGLSPVVLKAQVMLDRAGFSPGSIDGRGGENFEKALAAFQQARGLEVTRSLDEATWNKLTETSSSPAVIEYTITARDAKGPFVKRIPHDYEDMAKLERLGYRGPRELLSEKFHMSEDLLSALNKGADFRKADRTILVANVTREAQAEARGKQDPNTGSADRGSRKKEASPKAARLEVNKTERAVRVYDDSNNLLAYYPASIGSEEKPAPNGDFEVKAVAKYPTYHYDPKYAFKGQRATEKVEVPPGPNNPVGAVWIALSAESYGIHGTPEPDKISKSYSHGCVRLTNWDALALADLVKKGTPVSFVD